MKHPIALFITLLLFAPGCVSIWHHNELEQRVQTLEIQKAELEAQQEKERTEREQIRTEMGEATDALRRGGANLGADLDILKNDIAKLKGKEEEFAFQLSRVNEAVAALKQTLEERANSPVPQLPFTVTENKDSLFAAGKEAFEAGDNSKTRGALRTFVDSFPDDQRVPEAYYLIAETYFRTEQYGQAIKEYQIIHDKYKGKGGALVGKSLLRIAEALIKQGECKKAMAVYQLAVEHDKKGPDGRKAKQALTSLKKTCK